MALLDNKTQISVLVDGLDFGRWHITRYEIGATGHKLNYPRIDEVKP